MSNFFRSEIYTLQDPTRTSRFLEEKAYKLVIVVFLLTALSCRLTSTSTPQPSTSPALAPGLQIGIMPTTLGGFTIGRPVDPDRVGGGMLVTVEEVQPKQSVTVAWQRTVEREISSEEPTPVVGIGTPAPTPDIKTMTQEGLITGQALDDAHAALLPIYWPQVETEATDTSLMWLSSQAFNELKETRQTRWSADVLTRLSNLPRWALDQIDEATADRNISLTAEPEFIEFEVTIDNQPTAVQAIEAIDDFGNEYIILDNAENPLILKFTFNAVSTGAIGIDVGIWTLIKAFFSGYQVVEIRQ